MPNRPRPKPALIIHSEQPLNAGPPLARIRAACIAPQQDFYVFTHGDIPQLDAAKHRLRVGGPGRNAAQLVHKQPAMTLPVPDRDGGDALRRQSAGGLRQVRPVSGDR